MTLAAEFIEPGKVRRASRSWPCAGSGGGQQRHAEECPGHIEPGETYYEYLGNSHAYQAGSRHTLACARAFYRRDE